MSISNLFHPSYWFTRPDIATGGLLWIFLIVAILLVGGGIAMKIISGYTDDKVEKEIWRRFGSLTITMALLGFMWLFFRQELVPMFSWRFWGLVWFLGLVWWLTSIVKYAVRRGPEIRREQMERERVERYLPKGNR